MKSLIILLINIYSKYLSFDRGLLMILAPGGACKYFPTCSIYTKQMVVRYGIIKGIYLGLRRILTCR